MSDSKSQHAQSEGRLKLIKAFDRDTGSAAVLDGRLISCVNFDEHGSEGAAVQENFAANLAAALGTRLVRVEMPDAEYIELIGELEPPAGLHEEVQP